MAIFKEVYKEYGKRVYYFLLSLTGDENMAEELLQETFYQVFLNIDKFEGKSSVYTWICQIGKNAWIKECKRRSRFTDKSVEDETVKDFAVSPEEAVIKKEQCRKIREAVQRLPEPYKEVFVLHVYGEVKLREIAAMYEKSESWAKVTYFRAKEKIIKEAGL
ncbi:MAG: sigma-70 family RNA polymerase sigma factor [Lachnospiraceae bacterium]|nr:sigma-70 family RNA polymerase sigma factor [Lachnospiraceae bacterium]